MFAWEKKREMEKVNLTEVYYSLVNNRGHLVLFLCVLTNPLWICPLALRRSSSMISSTNMLHGSHQNSSAMSTKEERSMILISFSPFSSRVTRPGHEPGIVTMFCCIKGLLNQLVRLDLHMTVCNISFVSGMFKKDMGEISIHPPNHLSSLSRSLSQLLRPQAADTLDRWAVAIK